MQLAFYYHIPVTVREGGIYVPGYLGVFLDSLASEVAWLYLLMHESRPDSHEATEADYCVSAPNLTWLRLGVKTPAWHRAIFHQKILKEAVQQIAHCDCLLVRSPSPLAPYFHLYAQKLPIVFMIVGDYGEEAAHAAPRSFREWAMWKFIAYNDRLFVHAMKNADIVTNSPKLYRKYAEAGKSIFQIKTTTLSQKDFFERPDTCQNEVVQLLYTGRIDPLKGLFELVEAMPALLAAGLDVVLNLVGWEPDPDRPVEKALQQKAATLDIEKRLVFHGRKTVGAELNALYRTADVYVIPSHHEGFPRTIWEAMANSLPVVASRVGAIPDYLTDEENALLIEPKRVDEIVEHIILLIREKDLRKKLIANGLALANQNTLEVQTKYLTDHLKRLMDGRKK